MIQDKNYKGEDSPEYYVFMEALGCLSDLAVDPPPRGRALYIWGYPGRPFNAGEQKIFQGDYLAPILLTPPLPSGPGQLGNRWARPSRGGVQSGLNS